MGSREDMKRLASKDEIKRKGLSSVFSSWRGWKNNSPPANPQSPPSTSSSNKRGHVSSVFNSPGSPPPNSKNTNRIFGQRLDPNARVPPVVNQLITFLEEHASNVDGVFRISGLVTKVQEMKQAYERDEPVDLSPYTDDNGIHLVAGVFKLYLREMPEPLLTFGLYQTFIAANDISNPDDKLNCMRDMMMGLPPSHIRMLKRIMQLMVKISQHSHVNRMTANNLAIVIGPNILRPEVQTMEAIINDTPIVTALVEIMIKESSYIFQNFQDPDPVPEPVAVVAAANIPPPPVSPPTTPKVSHRGSVPSPMLVAAAGNMANARGSLPESSSPSPGNSPALTRKNTSSNLKGNLVPAIPGGISLDELKNRAEQSKTRRLNSEVFPIPERKPTASPKPPSTTEGASAVPGTTTGGRPSKVIKMDSLDDLLAEVVGAGKRIEESAKQSEILMNSPATERKASKPPPPVISPNIPRSALKGSATNINSNNNNNNGGRTPRLNFSFEDEWNSLEKDIEIKEKEFEQDFKQRKDSLLQNNNNNNNANANNNSGPTPSGVASKQDKKDWRKSWQDEIQEKRGGLVSPTVRKKEPSVDNNNNNNADNNSNNNTKSWQDEFKEKQLKKKENPAINQIAQKEATKQEKKDWRKSWQEEIKEKQLNSPQTRRKEPVPIVESTEKTKNWQDEIRAKQEAKKKQLEEERKLLEKQRLEEEEKKKQELLLEQEQEKAAEEEKKRLQSVPSFDNNNELLELERKQKIRDEEKKRKQEELQRQFEEEEEKLRQQEELLFQEQEDLERKLAEREQEFALQEQKRIQDEQNRIQLEQQAELERQQEFQEQEDEFLEPPPEFEEEEPQQQQQLVNEKPTETPSTTIPIPIPVVAEPPPEYPQSPPSIAPTPRQQAFENSRVGQVKLLVEGALQKITESLERVKGDLQRTVEAFNVPGILIVARVIHTSHKILVEDPNATCTVTSEELKQVDVTPNALAASSISADTKAKIAKINEAISASMRDIEHNISSTIKDLLNELDTATEEVVISRMVETVRLMRNVQKVLDCLTSQRSSSPSSPQQLRSSSNNVNTNSPISLSSSTELNNNNSKQQQDKQAANISLLRKETARLVELIQIQLKQPVFSAFKSVEEVLFLTPVLRSAKQVLKMSFDDTKQYVIPQFVVPPVLKPLPPTDPRLQTLSNVVRLIIAEISSDVNKLMTDLDQSDSVPTSVGIARTLKMVHAILEHTQALEHVPVAPSDPPKTVVSPYAHQFGNSPVSPSTSSGSDSGGVDISAERLMKIKTITMGAVQAVRNCLHLLRNCLRDTNSIEDALFYTQIARNLRKVVDDPSINVHDLIVKKAPVQAAVTQETIQKLNMLKNLTTQLFGELESVLDNVKNETDGASDLALITSNAHLLRNLKMVFDMNQ